MPVKRATKNPKPVPAYVPKSNEWRARIGQTVYLRLAVVPLRIENEDNTTLTIPVKVLSVHVEWGNIKAKIEPVGGSGTRKVFVNRLSLEPR